MKLSALIKSWSIAGGNVLITFMGGVAAPTLSAVTSILTQGMFGGVISVIAFNATPQIDASLGNDAVVTATANTAMLFSAPTNPPAVTVTQTINVTIRNASGGVMGAVTWNAIFKIAGAFTVPANGFSRSIQFRWNGTNWVETYRSAADISN